MIYSINGEFTMNKLEELIEEWSKDSQIDRTEPGRELLEIPKLHQKYLKILSHYRQGIRKAESKYAKMKKIKWEYYTGKLDVEQLKEYGWEPFQFVLKSDISTYLDADDDLIKLMEAKAFYQEIVSCCEAIMKELHSRTFQLRSFIDYEKFIQGAG